MDEDDWDDLAAADEAAKRAVPAVVMRYRESSALTWALLHQMESEVLAELAASGEHPDFALNMIRSAPVLGYPRDDRPASFGGAAVVPIIFRQIEKVWNTVH
jgi:hypothetical protein